MSSLTRIQEALVAIDQGAFQHLCDHLLYATGYQGVTQTGAVVGANKVARGTPDTRFRSRDGRYVFAEYTTQQSNVLKKLLKDVGKCLDPRHSRVPVSEVAEIVVCHTSKLAADEEKTLRDAIVAHGVGARILGLSELSFMLLEHPGITRDHLGIAVDTGQILSPPEFVRVYQRHPLSTPIDTEFTFRKVELDAALGALRSSEILVLSGAAGVGKTRFALEVARRHSDAEPGLLVSCIYNHGVEMFEDLRTHYAGRAKHLVVVDDANRIAALESVFSVLRSLGPATEIAIIATVRDYASEAVLRAAKTFGNVVEITLEAMPQSEVRDLVERTHHITDHLLLDRIAALARGNPRLAVMAARAALDKETFDQIHDASTLYERYFASIEPDLGALGEDHLRAAAVVALFGAIDKRNGALLEAIELGLGVSASVLWEHIRQLHQLELVDLHENEVAKTADQVLSTYLMYRCFFKLGALPFAAVLRHFFPRHRDRIMDALHPIAVAFTGDHVVAKVRTAVAEAREVFLARDDGTALMHLYDAFGGIEPTATLQFVKARIDALPAVPDVPYDFPTIKPESVARPSVLTVLQGFRSAEMDDLRIAIELMLRYVERSPEAAGAAARILDDEFGFDKASYRRRYEREHAVVEALLRRVGAGSPLFARLFLYVGGQFLQIEVQQTRSDGRDKLTIERFVPPCTPALLGLRAAIWNAVLRLSRDARFKDEALAILRAQRGSGLLGGDEQVRAAEAEFLHGLLVEHLDVASYLDCAAARDYSEVVARVSPSVASSLRERFCGNATLVLAELLSGHRLDRAELSFDAQQAAWRQAIREHVATLDLEGLEELFSRVPEILASGEKNGPGFGFRFGVTEVLLCSASSSPRAFTELVRRSLAAGNPARIEPWGVAAELVRLMGPAGAVELVSMGTYALEVSWKFAVLFSTSPSDATMAHVELLCELYATGAVSELWFDIRQWDRFSGVEPSIMARLLSVVLERAKEEPASVAAIRCLFMSFDEESAAILRTIDQRDRRLVHDAYFAYLALDAHGDHDGAALDFLIDVNDGVLDRLADFALEDADASYGGGRSYVSIWKRSDYATTSRRLVLAIFDKLASEGARWPHFPSGLFLDHGDEESADGGLRERQDEVLCTILREDSSRRPGLVRAIFRSACHFSTGRRLRLIRVLLEVDASVESFRRLSLVPSSMSWSGSQVPPLQERVEFWKSLRSELRGVELLDHRRFVEERLHHAEAEVIEARRREFLRD